MNPETKTTKTYLVKSPSVLDQLKAPFVRTCMLNLIAQMALGTPMAAQVPRNSHPTLMARQRVIAPSTCLHSVAKKASLRYAAVKEHKNSRNNQSRLNVIAV